jgi:hypothetical protein
LAKLVWKPCARAGASATSKNCAITAKYSKYPTILFDTCLIPFGAGLVSAATIGECRAAARNAIDPRLGRLHARK